MSENYALAILAIFVALNLAIMPSFGVLHFGEAFAAPSYRLNKHVCQVLFQGIWDAKTKTCMPSANQTYTLSSGQSLIIPRSTTLQFTDNNVALILEDGAQLVNYGKVLDSSGCSEIHIQGGAKIVNNGNIEPLAYCSDEHFFGLDIESGGLFENNGSIRSAYYWYIVNNQDGTLNNYGAIFIGLDGIIANQGSLYNYGIINVGTAPEDQRAQLANYEGGTIYNHGVIFLALESEESFIKPLFNMGSIINDGRIIGCGEVNNVGSITGNPVESCPT